MINTSITQETQNRPTAILSRYKAINPTVKKVALLASAVLLVAGVAALATGLSLSLKDITIAGGALTALSGGTTLGIVYLNRAAAKLQDTRFTAENPQHLPVVVPAVTDLEEEKLTQKLAHEYHRIPYIIARHPITKRLTPSEEDHRINDVTTFIQEFRKICNEQKVTDSSTQNKALYFLQQDATPMLTDLAEKFPDYKIVDTRAQVLQTVHIDDQQKISTEFSGKICFKSQSTNDLYATYHIRTDCKTGEMSYWFTNMEQFVKSTDLEIPEGFYKSNASNFASRGEELPSAIYYIGSTLYLPPPFAARKSPEHTACEYMTQVALSTNVECINDQRALYFSHQAFPQEILSLLQSPSHRTFLPELNTGAPDTRGGVMKVHTSKQKDNILKITAQFSLSLRIMNQHGIVDETTPVPKYTLIATIPNHRERTAHVQLFRQMPHVSLVDNLNDLQKKAGNAATDNDTGSDFILDPPPIATGTMEDDDSPLEMED